jgi:hypothetical protein
MSALSAILRGASSRSGAAVGRILQGQQYEQNRMDAQSAAEAQAMAAQDKLRREAEKARLDAILKMAGSGISPPADYTGDLSAQIGEYAAANMQSAEPPKMGTIPPGYMWDAGQGSLAPIPGYVAPAEDPMIKEGGSIAPDENGVLTWTPIANFPGEDTQSKRMTQVRGNLMFFDDGTTKTLTSAEQVAAEAHIMLEHNNWLQKEGARQENRIVMSNARYWQHVNTSIKQAVIDAQKAVQDGMSMEDAEDMIRAAAVGTSYAEEYIAAAQPLLSDNELKIDWTPTQLDDLTNLNTQVHHADVVIEMGQDDTVRSEMAHLTNAWEKVDQYLGGEGTFSEPTRRYLTYLKHVKDDIQRSRTGAAISANEAEFYDSLTGNAFTTVDVIEERMQELQEYSRNKKDTMWSTRLEDKYSDNPTGRDRAWKKYETRERRHRAQQMDAVLPEVTQGLPTGMTDADFESP